MKVINYKNLPARIPLTTLIVWYLVLDKWGVPGWLWGVMGMVAVIVVIAETYKFFTQQLIDLREE